MQTRIINTKIYRDKQFRKLSHKDKFVLIFLLTNEYLEALPVVEIDLEVLAFNSSTTEEYLETLIPKLSYFQVFYIDGYLFVGDLFTYANYKGGKTSKRKKELYDSLPDNIKKYIDIEGDIAQLLGNDCSIIEHINHKSKNIKHKSKIINHKTAEVEILEKGKFTLEDFIKDFNEIRGFYMPNSRGLKVVDSKTQRQFKDLLKQGVTQEDMQQALRAMFADKYHQETSWRYCTPEFITRSDKFARFSMTEEYQAQDRKTGQVGII